MVLPVGGEAAFLQETETSIESTSSIHFAYLITNVASSRLGLASDVASSVRPFPFESTTPQYEVRRLFVGREATIVTGLPLLGHWVSPLSRGLSCPGCEDSLSGFRLDAVGHYILQSELLAVSHGILNPDPQCRSALLAPASEGVLEPGVTPVDPLQRLHRLLEGLNGNRAGYLWADRPLPYRWKCLD